MLEVHASVPIGTCQPSALQPAFLDFEYGRSLDVILKLAVGFDCHVQPVSARKQ
jgi:hypothetical protein